MGKCCIPGCRNCRERIPGLTFHQIPSGEPWRTLWIDVLSKQGVQLFTEWTLVCGEHFTHEDYKMTARKNFLLPSAIPSVFKEPTTSHVPKKRGRKPKSQQTTVLRSLVAEDGDVPDDDDDDMGGAASPRRTGRLRKQKVYTDMVVYMPKPPEAGTDSGEQGQGGDESGGGTDIGAETISFRFQQPPQDEPDDAEDPEYAESDEEDNEDSSDKPGVGSREVASNPKQASQAPKNVNVIVFSNQPRRLSRLGAESGPSATDTEPRPKRRCCQIQTQRLLFYKSVIVKLRKRVLALEASLQEKEKELADFR